MARSAGLAVALRHRDFRFLMGAYTAASIGGWAYNVGLAVWIFDQTGSAAWIGAATICRFVPALLFGPYGGVLADRFERVRLMVTLDVVAAVLMGALVLVTTLDLPVPLAIVITAVASTVGTMYEPAVAALTPQLVGERDLGAANTLRNTIDNLCVIAGPGVGALLLLLGPAPLAIGLNGVMYAASGAMVSRIRARSQPTDVTEGGSLGVVQQMLVGIKAIGSSSTTLILVAYSVAATLVYGFDTVQFVVLSRDVLGTGAEGYGYLLAGLGVGGLMAAPLVVRLERLPWLGWVILAGMAAYCLPTLLFLIVDEPLAAFVVEAVRGAGTLVVDVLAVTALQRALPNDVLARVFGAFDSLLLVAIVVGASVAPLVINAWGIDASLWIAGLVIPLLSLLGRPALQRMDRRSAVRRAELAPRQRLLAACDLFAHVSDGGLEQLAEGAEIVDVTAGSTVVVEGDPAESFYVVERGLLSVAARGEGVHAQPISALGPGEYFGEIGLIEHIPRTATITALEPTRLIRLSGSSFVDALSEYAPSAALLQGASLRLGRTHPSLHLGALAADAPASSDESG